MHPWFILVSMWKESLVNLIRSKLDQITLPKVDAQDDIDLQNLVGHVAPNLRSTFAYPQIGEVDAPKTNVGWVSESLNRLLAKRGNSIQKIANQILSRVGGPDLNADKNLHLQYKASVLTSLRDLQESGKNR